MSYPETMDWGETLKRKSNAVDTAINLAAAAASYAGYGVMYPICLRRLYFMVTTQVTAGLTAPIVNFQYHPTYASATGAVTLGTLSIPNGTTVGSVVYKDISDSTRLIAGSELSLYGQVAAVDSGTAAGAGWFGMIWELDPDADANSSNLIKSI